MIKIALFAIMIFSHHVFASWAFSTTGLNNTPIQECVEVSQDALNSATLAMNCVSSIKASGGKVACSGDRVLHVFETESACKKFRNETNPKDRKYWLKEDPYNQIVSPKIER